MPPSRVSREEFFAKLAPLDAGQRGKVLRNPYWRGTAAVRERIEGELDPPERERRRRDAAAPPDPAQVSRRSPGSPSRPGRVGTSPVTAWVSPAERTKWRVTFRRLTRTHGGARVRAR